MLFDRFSHYFVREIGALFSEKLVFIVLAKMSASEPAS